MKFLHKQQPVWIYVSAAGLVLIVAGILLTILFPCRPYWGAILTGTGGSVLATWIVTLLGPLSEESYQRFRQLGITGFYPSRNEVPKAEWVDRLSRATRACTLLGIAHGEWCREARFSDALVDRLRRGVEVEIFFLDPKGRAVEVRATEDAIRNTQETIRNSIRFLWDLRARLQADADAQARLKLYVYDATPSSGVTWIDCSMIVTHYLAGFANLTSPALMVQPVDGSLEARAPYGVYAQNFQKIRDEHSTEITEENVQHYTSA